MWKSARKLAPRALCALSLLTSLAAVADKPRDLQSEWWQWAMSIPGPVNPLTDISGQYCMVGQSGDVWFLGGVFGGGTASRACSVPQGVKLYFPVANVISFDAPNICGQVGSLSVAELRASSAGPVDGLTQVRATLNGVPVRTVKRTRSKVFPVYLPVDNLFAPYCGQTPVPSAIYPRSVDDGYYGEIDRLRPGTHTLQLFAADANGTSINVIYTLTVVPRD